MIDLKFDIKYSQPKKGSEMLRQYDAKFNLSKKTSANI